MENVGVKDNYMLIQRLKSAGCFIVCVLLALICLVPLYIMIMNATHGDAALRAQPLQFLPGSDLVKNIKNIAGGEFPQSPNFNVWLGYRNSLIIAGGSTILTVFFSALTSYGLTVYDFKVRDGAYTFILAVMMIPIQVTSTGFVKFMVGTLGLANSYIPLIIPAIAAPAVVFYIAIPMCKPAIAVQAIFAFVQNWNNFYTQNMIIISNEKRFTMPIMIQSVLGQDKHPDLGAQYAAVALSVIPIIVIYLILSRFIVAGVALGGVKE